MNKYKLILKDPINKQSDYQQIIVDLKEKTSWYSHVKGKGCEKIMFHSDLGFSDTIKNIHLCCLWHFDNTNFELQMY